MPQIVDRKEPQDALWKFRKISLGWIRNSGAKPSHMGLKHDFLHTENSPTPLARCRSTRKASRCDPDSSSAGFADSPSSTEMATSTHTCMPTIFSSFSFHFIIVVRAWWAHFLSPLLHYRGSHKYDTTMAVSPARRPWTGKGIEPRMTPTQLSRPAPRCPVYHTLAPTLLQISC